MKFAVIALVTAGAVLAATPPLHGADGPGRGQTLPTSPPTSIIITNKTDGSAPTRDPYLSAGLPEIVKMHKAGVDASVLLAFIQSSPVAYNPSAKEIIYLRDSGISNEIISAMLRRGGELRDRAAEARREEKARAPAAPQPAAPAPAPPQSNAPPPAVVYANEPYPVYSWPVYYSYSAYRYGYPGYCGYYNYPYYRRSCYPSVSAGFRWGCNPSYGLSVGYGGSSAWGIVYRGGYHGGYHGAYYGGYHGGARCAGGSYCRR